MPVGAVEQQALDDAIMWFGEEPIEDWDATLNYAQKTVRSIKTKEVQAHLQQVLEIPSRHFLQFRNIRPKFSNCISSKCCNFPVTA
jgi:hypothetical protein